MVELGPRCTAPETGSSWSFQTALPISKKLKGDSMQLDFTCVNASVFLLLFNSIVEVFLLRRLQALQCSELLGVVNLLYSSLPAYGDVHGQ